MQLHLVGVFFAALPGLQGLPPVRPAAQLFRLPCDLWKNPHNRNYAPMRMYDKEAVRLCAGGLNTHQFTGSCWPQHTTHCVCGPALQRPIQRMCYI
jgi:hypothetical protein